MPSKFTRDAINLVNRMIKIDTCLLLGSGKTNVELSLNPDAYNPERKEYIILWAEDISDPRNMLQQPLALGFVKNALRMLAECGSGSKHGEIDVPVRYSTKLSGSCLVRFNFTYQGEGPPPGLTPSMAMVSASQKRDDGHKDNTAGDGADYLQMWGNQV